MPTRPPRHKPLGYRRTAPGPEPRPPIRKHQPRESAHRRGYTRAWQKARDGYLRKHPLCVHCLAKDLVVAATEVDHITPHRNDDRLFWDSENNWQALCKPCHSAKTATEDGGFGNERKS